MRTHLHLTALSTAVVLALTACGGGGGGSSSLISSPAAITGTAATGGPITGGAGSTLNGVVTIKDSSSTPKTAVTPTDAKGNYSFTTAQLAGMTGPYMLEINYQVGGVSYYLHSAATATDLSSGTATINITPLTDLVVANLAHDIATNVFKNGNFSSTLTASALAAGATALATQLQPLLALQGVTGSVDLLHQSFSANGTGLDAVLDALKVTVDPTTKMAQIANRLNGTSISNDITLPPASNNTLILVSNSVLLTDLQAVTNYFTAFSVEMASAPTNTDPKLLAFFDPTNFLEEGKTLTLFLQEITTSPTVVGGALTFTDISLDPVPAWVTNVPASATAYKANFTFLLNKAPAGRAEFIVYKTSGGQWLALGDQKKANADIGVLETSGFANGVPKLCTGLNPNIGDKGGFGVSVSYAVITSSNASVLPAGGLLVFNHGSGNFNIAANGPSSYVGTTTPQLPALCGFTSVYPLTDTAIMAIKPGDLYTINLYNDKGTPTNRTDDTLLAVYTATLPAAPLLSTQLGAKFPTGGSATPGLMTLAAGGGGNSTITWTAPAAAGMYASNVSFYLAASTTPGSSVFKDVAWDATTASIAVPSTPGVTTANLTIQYTDGGFREYWAEF